jgi:hypothetical protein
MRVTINLASRKFIVEDMAEWKRCNPITPVVPPKENCLPASNRAESSYEKMRPFSPALNGDIFKPVRVPSSEKYLALLAPPKRFHCFLVA